MELDEAIAILVDLLQRDQAKAYGYDLYPPKGAEAASGQLPQQDHQQREAKTRELAPIFFDAAWELCRRGLVRPGVRGIHDQAVPEQGYSLTQAGRAMLVDIDPATIMVMQPGSLARTFAGYKDLFGGGLGTAPPNIKGAPFVERASLLAVFGMDVADDDPGGDGSDDDQ
jgi:hypothetical protein